MSANPDYFWPEHQPGDELPDPPETEIEWIGIGDRVVVDGPKAAYPGLVVDSDPGEQRVLVRAWDCEVSNWYTAWWDVDFVRLAATA